MARPRPVPQGQPREVLNFSNSVEGKGLVAVDRSAFFTSDRIAVRVTVRVGFGFPHEEAVVAVLPIDLS